MTTKHLHQKRALRSALFFLLLCVVGIIKSYAADFDFSSVCSTGQTLYYRITNDETHEVQLTYPNMSTDYWHTGTNPRWYDYHYEHLYWKNYERPTGNIVVPYFVEYEGISYSVTSIRDHTFGNHNYQSNSGHYYYYYDQCTDITSIVIPSSVITIGDDAFARCTGLTTVTIPTSVTSIGEYVFNGCSNLVTVNFNATNCSGVGSNTWIGCSSFTTLNLGNTVTRIPNYGFQDASVLASVSIPRKVTTIGNYAFNGCTNLANVTIANNSVLTSIGQYAFQNCTNLTNVTFNGTSQLNSIDTYAFQNCSKLATINLPNTLASIGNYAFNGCSLLQSTTESQLLPNALEAIGDYAFQNASTLAYIHIPSTITSIGKYAFKSCTALNTVDFEATNCTYSGTQAEPPFFYCSGLATVNVSDNVTQIPAYCFKDCTSLTNLTLRNGLSEIGTYAFYCCMNISSLILPTSVTSIGSFAFGNAYDMQIANVESHNPIPPTIGEEAVFPAGQTIYVPYASLNDYESAEYWEDYFFEGMAVKTVSGYGTSTESDKWVFIASPLTDNTAPTTIDGMIAETATEYDLYRFNQSAELEWENWKSHANNNDHYHFNLKNGQGYLYANKNNVNLVFKEAFNEGTSMDVELAYTEGMRLAGWNLVGNPFPYSATVTGRSYYVMNEAGTGINPEAVSAGGTIDACTGIVVKAESTETNPTVTFSKVSRQATSNIGLLQIAVAKASTRSNVIEDKAVLSFNEGDQLSKFYFGEQKANIYIPQGAEEYAIATSNGQGEMPLNFKAKENGQYTISVDPENVEMNYLHLIDHITGVDIDLLAMSSYTFTAKVTDYESRFRLVFSANGISTGSATDETFAYYADGEIIIMVDMCDASLQVIDLMGRVVCQGDAMNHVSTGGMVPGVYVLRLINGENVKVQKVVIE